MPTRELIDVLETLLRQHEQMIEYGQNKKEALIANNIDLLNEMVNKEARLLKLIAEADARRVAVANNFLKEMGLASTPSTRVAQLIGLVTNAGDKMTLSKLADRLSTAVEKLRAVNDLNMKLTKQSIEFNDFSLDLLSGAYGDQDYVYKRPTQQIQSQSKLNFFDSRA